MKKQNNSTETYPINVGADSISAQKHRGIKNKHGITLIALVITIIILLILAGVVLNLTLGEHGILKQAEQGAEQYKISEILEKLELEKVDLLARKNGEVPSLQEYIDHLINKGIISEADVMDIDDNNKNITVDGYVFLVEKEASGNIKITYQGKATNEPRIAKIQLIGTTIDSISVKTIAANADGGSYKYSIKNITLGETEFTVVTTLNTNEYTFTGLTIDNDYIIQVELVTSKGNDIKETGAIKTEIPKVTNITLDKMNIELLKGVTDTITAEVLPENALDKTITWTSSNESVVTIDNDGNITAVGEGVAVITVTSNDGSNIKATCNVTVTLPPPPIIGAGGTTHTAKQIPYTWEELSRIAKVISDNYGTGEGQVNNDTAEVNVSINGKSDTLGIGDWTTVNGKKVRILGFNHDTLTNTNAYCEESSNTYAGISFEYVDFVISLAKMNNSTSSFSTGWGGSNLRGTLNSSTINSLQNREYVKQVRKKYVSSGVSLTISNDYLWLLSGSEIWTSMNRGVVTDGTRYKYYKNVNANSTVNNANLVKGGGKSWWTRSYSTYAQSRIHVVTASGSDSDAPTAGDSYGVAPGFCI